MMCDSGIKEALAITGRGFFMELTFPKGLSHRVGTDQDRG
jgi:hypothetical protein